MTPPPWRFDLQIEEDLIEEVIRVIGYDKLPLPPPLAPVWPTRAARGAAQRARGAPRMRATLDYQETISFSFVEDALGSMSWPATTTRSRVLNPIAAPLAVMRSSLVGSLVDDAAPQPGATHAIACACSRSARVYRRDPSVAAAD